MQAINPSNTSLPPLDGALTVSQNDTAGLIGVTYRPTADNIGRGTVFMVGKPYLEFTQIWCFAIAH